MEKKNILLIVLCSFVGLLIIIFIIAISIIFLNKRKGNLKLQKILLSKKPIIGYYCGSCPVRFSPNVSKLGGSETAVVNLAKEWQRMGYQVIVFGTVIPGEYNGVLYIDASQFDITKKMDHLVLWRLMGSRQMLPRLQKKNYKSILLDLHDGDPYSSFPLESIPKVDYVMLKSNYQKSLYNGKFKINSENLKVIPNGVTDIEEYRSNKNIPKIAKKLVYTSCYLRGLEGILKVAWPIIIERFPDSQLHLFYGMELVDNGYKTMMKNLIRQYPTSVFDHGRLDRAEVRKNCADAFIHFYPCTASCEIDCISVKEMACQGTIPVIPNSFVFPERAGIHFDGVPNTSHFFQNAAKTAIQLINDFDKSKSIIRNQIDPVLQKTIFSWEQIAKSWKECFN